MTPPVHGREFLVHGLFGRPLVPREVPPPTARVGELRAIVLTKEGEAYVLTSRKHNKNERLCKSYSSS